MIDDIPWAEDLRNFCRDNPPVEGVDYILLPHGHDNKMHAAAVETRKQFRERDAETARRLWQNPDYVANVMIGFNKANTPAVKEKRRLSFIKANTPEVIAKRAASIRATNARKRALQSK